jgi:RNA polymerase sigma-70 factor, ECF subfamily
MTVLDGDVGARLEAHRVELTGYCYRMLGSAAEADDAVQETLVRAWRAADRFEGRSTLRAWLYRIATNVCFAATDARRRRALPVDLGPAGWAPAPPGSPPPAARSVPEATWIEPVPDAAVLSGGGPGGGDPAEAVVARESIRLAFVAALQYLPARQRAVLILRQVLRWPAAEVALLLDTTVVSVNSALQRARQTLAAAGLDEARRSPGGAAALDAADRALLARYVDAFERYDIDALVGLLHDDVVSQMPPVPFWLLGPDAVRTAALSGDPDDPGSQPCRGSRLVPVAANGCGAFAQYRPPNAGNPAYHAWALQVIEIRDDRIATMTSFLDVATVFPRFGLPLTLAG